MGQEPIAQRVNWEEGTGANTHRGMNQGWIWTVGHGEGGEW